MTIVYVFCGLVMIACVALLIHSMYMLSVVLPDRFRRNDAVFEYRSLLLHQISECSVEDILNGRDFTWRYRVYESVPYVRMVDEYKKPLDSFYPDKSFIQP